MLVHPSELAADRLASNIDWLSASRFAGPSVAATRRTHDGAISVLKRCQVICVISISLLNNIPTVILLRQISHGTLEELTKALASTTKSIAISSDDMPSINRLSRHPAELRSQIFELPLESEFMIEIRSGETPSTSDYQLGSYLDIEPRVSLYYAGGEMVSSGALSDLQTIPLRGRSTLLCT